MELASRKAHLGGISANPNRRVGGQQARNLDWKLQQCVLKAKFLLRDRDSQFTAAFDQVFGSEGVKVLRLPNKGALRELDRGEVRSYRPPGAARPLLIFSARHLEAVIKEFLVHYHQARPHQGPEQRCLGHVMPAPIPLPAEGRIVRRDRLGGDTADSIGRAVSLPVRVANSGHFIIHANTLRTLLLSTC